MKNEWLQKITDISVERLELNIKKLKETKDIELYDILMQAEQKWWAKVYSREIEKILEN